MNTDSSTEDIHGWTPSIRVWLGSILGGRGRLTHRMVETRFTLISHCFMTCSNVLTVLVLFKENLLQYKKCLFHFYQDHWSKFFSALRKSTSSTLLPRDQVSSNPWHPMCSGAKGEMRKGASGNYGIRRREAMFTLSIGRGPTKPRTRGPLCRISHTRSEAYNYLVCLKLLNWKLAWQLCETGSSNWAERCSQPHARQHAAGAPLLLWRKVWLTSTKPTLT